VRRLAFVALLAISGCSVLIPLDEFLEDGTGGAGGSTSSSSSAGGGGLGGGGGGAPPGCTPERETDPYNCGEAGYECEEAICAACMCEPHSMGDFRVTALLWDFGFGQRTNGTDVVVASLSLPMAAIDVLTVASDSWGITNEFILPMEVSERLIAENGRYFFVADGIYSRDYDLPQMSSSTIICQPSRPAGDTFDHISRGGSHIYRAIYGDGGSVAGQIDQCLTDINIMPPVTFTDATTAYAWEVVAGSTSVHWTNRTVGGGVHRAGAGDFGVAAPETLYTQPDGVPTALALVDGQVFLADCLRREVARVPPGGTSAAVSFPTVGHVAFFEAVKEPDNSVTFYAVETGDANLCANPVPAIYDGSLVRYRNGVPRVLAVGIRLPTAVHAHDGYVYWTQHPDQMPPQVLRVPL